MLGRLAVIALVLVANAARGDSLPDRSERVLGLARAWENVKFFHPYLGYKSIDWDAAFVAALPKVEAATSLTEYRSAVQAMLETLKDPMTRVVTAAPKPTPGKPRAEFMRWPSPDVLEVELDAITAGGFDPWVFYEKAQKIAEAAAKARVAIFDLRGAFADKDSDVLDFVVDVLPSIDEWPLQRKLEHRGYRTQEMPGGTDYTTAFVTTGTQVAHRAPPTGPKHVIFVADAATPIPAIAYALQHAGRATIVAPDAVREDSVAAKATIDMPGGFAVQVRVGELLQDPPITDVRAPDPGARARVLAKAGFAPAKPRPKRVLPPLLLRDDDDYPQPLPSRELRVLAGVRLWAVIDTFSPHRGLIHDWDGALREALPALEAAGDRDAYSQALDRLAAHTDDSHVNVATKLKRKPRGAPPIELRLVEGKLAIVRLLDAAIAKPYGFVVGEIIETIDGKPALDVLAAMRPVMAASNREGRDQFIARLLLQGDDGSSVTLGVRRGDGTLRSVTATRTAAMRALLWSSPPSPHWKKLRPDVGYVDLGAIQTAEIGVALTELANTRAIVFDMRGYPNFPFDLLGAPLNTRGARYMAEWRTPLVADGNVQPSWQKSVRMMQPIDPPRAPLYRGKVVVLIDDRTMSSAEHVCLTLEAAAGATFVGSPTAGADGDITNLRLPGAFKMSFTGAEVRHADGRPLQQVGIQPHVLVRPTLVGVRAGKDEVLERALATLDKR